MEYISAHLGYEQKIINKPVKRYCQTLDLVDKKEFVQLYIEAHNEENHWVEIRKGLREVGILEMEIYLFNNRLFMIVETGLEFDWEVAFTKLADMPRQSEWENRMSLFQQTEGGPSNTKWKLMERIFCIYDINED